MDLDLHTLTTAMFGFMVGLIVGVAMLCWPGGE
jgi:hypothetical protein